MQQKKILAGALGCLIVCSHPAAYLAAAGTPQVQANIVMAEEAAQEYAEDTLKEDSVRLQIPGDLAPDYNDPDYVKRLMQQEGTGMEESMPFSLRSVSEETTKSPFTGLIYTHGEQFKDREIVNGIDVSKWQADIDWEKVKAAGVKYVFIRCGYTALAEQFAMYEDPYFRQNIQGAYNAGIDVGIYFFSNSKTTSEAKKEANKTLELINAYKDMITLPVVYDFEAFSVAYRAYGLPKDQVTKNAQTYADIIQSAGYTPMYYGSPHFLDNSFDVSKLTDYDCWLANYTTQTSYAGDYTYWQYSSTGRVDGIEGNVDCNFYYAPVQQQIVDPSEQLPELGPVTKVWMADNATDQITIEWSALEEADGYRIYRSKSLGGSYKKLKTIYSNEITEYTDENVIESEGRQYYYKAIPFVVDEEGEMRFGVESNVLIANTLRLHRFRLKTTNNINLREQAGTEYQSMTVLPAGTALTFFKYTLSTKDVKWYKVTYTKNGRDYTGYLSGNYVDVYTYGNAKQKVNMRSGAGLTYKVQRKVPKNTKVTILKNKTDSTGTKWSQIKYTLNGKSYSGFIPTKYIDQI